MNMLIAKHNAKQAEALDRDAKRLLLQSIASAYNNILLARENIRIAESDAFSPTISANGFYGYLRTNTGSWKYTNWESRSQDRSYNYGLTASWTLFNGGQNWFNLKVSQAQLAQNQLAVVNKWIQVVSEVRQAQENYKQAIEQVTLFEETLGLVKKTRDLVEEEYKAGNANLTRVNQAQSDLVRAEADLASSRVNLENAKAQMEAAIGSR